MKALAPRLASPVLALPRPAKRAVALLVDLALCVLTVWLAFYLRLGEFIGFAGTSEWARGAVLAGAASVVIALPIFMVSGLYRAIFRYSGWPALLTVARAVSIYALLYAAIFTAIGVPGVPRTVGIIQPILLLLFVGASRALARLWLGEQYQSILHRAQRPRVLIYGAGQSGRQLAAAMVHSPELRVAGFLDDDERLHGRVLNALPIYNPADLPTLAHTLGIRDVLLAMPNIGRQRRNAVIEQMRAAHVAVRTLPSMNDLAQGKVSLADVRELDLDDLLGREPVAPNPVLLAKNIVGKVVLVTGAGGSIGSELCRQIWAVGPARLLLLEQSEFALYAIHHELEQKRAGAGAHSELLPLLASVQAPARLHEIMQT